MIPVHCAVVAALVFPKSGHGAERITRLDAPGASASDHSLGPRFSPDGGFLFFHSLANDLVTHDNLDVYLDLFSCRLSDGAVSLVSLGSSGVGGGNGDTYEFCVSSNGQHVAFASAASNLVEADTNRAVDIFLRDLTNGTTRLISKGSQGQNALQPPTDNNTRRSGAPSLSGEGRWLAFESYATNLTALPDDNLNSDVFLYDRATDQLTVVSVNAEGTAAAQGHSSEPSLSADGRWVAFVSTATDLVEGSVGTNRQIYVRDLLAGTTRLASGEVTAWASEPAQSNEPVLSADGSGLVFRANVIPYAPPFLVLYDIPAGQSVVITSNAHPRSQPVISADGRWIAYQDERDVYRWDKISGSNELVNVRWDGTGPGNQPAEAPAMTPDGRYLSFVSKANDLTDPPAPGSAQVYLRDMDTRTTWMVSLNTGGLPTRLDVDPVQPTVHPAGSTVAFQSAGRDLADNDSNRATDIFLRDIPRGTTQLISRRAAAFISSSHATYSQLSQQPIDLQARRVVYTASDNGAFASDTNKQPDVFIHDRVADSTIPLSVDPMSDGPESEPVFQAIGAADGPIISADGRCVVYMVYPRSYWLFPGRGNVVWLDLETGERRILDEDAGKPPEISPGYSFSPALSRDGRRIAFYNRGSWSGPVHLVLRDLDNSSQDWRLMSETGAADIVPGTFLGFSPNDEWLLFVAGFDRRLRAWNLATGQVRTVAANVAHLPSFNAPQIRFSADSRHVVFGVGGSTVERHDLLAPATSPNLPVCAGCVLTAIDGSAELVAYRDAFSSRLVVKSLPKGQTTQIIPPGDPSRYGAVLSRDGRYLCYLRDANLQFVGPATPAVFVRDLLTGVNRQLQPNLGDPGASSQTAGSLVLGPDGRTVVFVSYNPALVEGDPNHQPDIFLVQLGLGDSDNDGMDDQWEITYFDDLSRDGTGDLDQDGSNDRAEHVAGTNPTDDSSLLEVLMMTHAGGGSTTLIWSAVPGKVYQVEFKPGLANGEWSALSPQITAQQSTESYLDSAPADPSRYYRVRVVR